jgi:Zn-dependent protease with chaperone function
MVGIDFDFVRYVNHRRGLVEKRVRDGAAYAFVGERKVSRALSSARPVTLALEATSRRWRAKGKDELLSRSVKASDRDFPAVYNAGRRAAQALELPEAPIFILQGEHARVSAAALGVDDDAVVVLAEPLCRRLSGDELTCVIGRELAHIQNEHVLYGTALYYLSHESILPVRWAAQPAIVALSAWARRAALTCDRAAALAVRNADLAMMTLCRLEHPGLTEEAARAMIADTQKDDAAGLARYKEIFQSHPDLKKRLRALRIFSMTRFYRRAVGAPDEGSLTTEEADAQVSELLKVLP